MSGPAGAFDEYREHLLAHEPEWRLARALVDGTRAPAADAMRVLEAQLLDAAVDVRDASVAFAKLGWWREELDAAAQGRARHPVSIRAADTGLDPLRAGALLAGALAIAELESPPDVEAVLAPFARFARAIAPEAPSDAVPALGAAMLAMRLRRWPTFAQAGRSRVPLALLARHAVARDALASPAGGPVLAALAATLKERLADVPRLPSPEAARVACARHVVDALLRDPVRATEGATRARAVPLLWVLWRVGVRERRERLH